MELYNLMNQMGAFVTAYDTGIDWIVLWNSWIKTGVKIKDSYRPLLMAIMRELADIDRSILAEVLAVYSEGREDAHASI